MSKHTAHVTWTRDGAIFTDNKYSRVHRWKFDGGAEVSGSASPHVVPLPMSSAEAIDPEEAFVAAVSSCHMLWFLSLAAAKKLTVDSYDDQAIGMMGRIAEGRLGITKVELHPKVAFSGTQPTTEEIQALHHEAHERCFIANSIKSEVLVMS